MGVFTNESFFGREEERDKNHGEDQWTPRVKKASFKRWRNKKTHHFFQIVQVGAYKVWALREKNTNHSEQHFRQSTYESLCWNRNNNNNGNDNNIIIIIADSNNTHYNNNNGIFAIGGGGEDANDQFVNFDISVQACLYEQFQYVLLLNLTQ